MPVISSTAAIAASSAAVVAATSANHQHIAKLQHCNNILNSYNSTTATVQQMQEYANCVDAVYTKEPDASSIILFKVVFVIAVVAMIITAIREYKITKEIVWSSFVGFIGFIMAICTSVFIGLLYFGFVWLFSYQT